MDDNRHFRKPPRGRASGINPKNRFESDHFEPDVEDYDPERRAATVLHRDSSRRALSESDSPDLALRYGLNPYRGCEHGCSYCFARPYHEYLGFSAGLDFETQIVVKYDIARLLDTQLSKKEWVAEPIFLSGATDPYQPLERKLRLTRACLEVFLHHRHPVAMITKNQLVTRDLDLLEKLAARNLVSVTLSITTLRDDVVNKMEPRTARPRRRIETIRRLADAGVPVGVNVAPVIPGLTDEEMPAILEAAAEAGASFAGFQIVRLPGAVTEVFQTWLRGAYPNRAEKVLSRIRQIRGGQLNDSRFGSRQTGEGPWASLLAKIFSVHTQRLGLNRRGPTLATHHYLRTPCDQGNLFAEAD
ncbi:hypothetical protein BH23BAC4_BH23BAC4_03530 [soil metagenome]